MNSSKILIVLDEEILASGLQLQFKRSGYRTEIVRSSEAALNSLRNEIPSLIILHVSLKGTLDGIETAVAIHQLSLPLPPIVFLDDTHITLKNRSKELPALQSYAYLPKPCTVKELATAVEKVSEVRLVC